MTTKWPTLQKSNELSYIDIAFAEQFTDSEHVAAVYCYMLLAVRSGHLCVQINDDTIFPPLEKSFKELVIKGIKEIKSPVIRQFGSLYYFQRNWRDESIILEQLKRLIQDKPTIAIDLTPQNVTPTQADAIQCGLNQCLTLISGGPGTGKTYTAGQLISLLPDHVEIALAAPTGKAAANLQQGVHLKNIQALTLHKLLQQPALSADFILIDESSMIDVRMMAKLLSAIKPGARLVLLGDPNQLPPVETGHIFTDMVNYLNGKPNLAQLTECLRTDRETLLSFATAVKEGECQAALHFLKGHTDIYRLDSPMDEIIKHFPTNIQEDDALEAFEKFRVLSPLRKGKFGVDTMNSLIFEKVDRKFIPIILTHHAKELDLYNGDTGVLVKEEGYALFSGKKVPIYMLPKYEYAYCLSVHKSQGSEYDHVILLLPEGSEQFGRQVLYTAATRAKKQLGIFCSDQVFSETVQNSVCRLSGLEKRLID